MEIVNNSINNVEENIVRNYVNLYSWICINLYCLDVSFQPVPLDCLLQQDEMCDAILIDFVDVFS